MPVYEYECKQCGQRHEVMQRLSDSPVTICPECKGEVYRVLSPSGLSFKGEGWYITDYARKGQDKADENKKGVEKEAKTDLKSETPKAAASEKKEAAASSPPQSSPPPSGSPKDKKD